MPQTKTEWFSFAKNRLTELAVALLLVFLIIQLEDEVTSRQRQAIPAEAWFDVNEVYVPDHKVGEDPIMIYDRTISESFRGFFVVEVQLQQANGLWFPACSGSGTGDYDPTDVIPERRVKWSWFINRECVVDPGGGGGNTGCASATRCAVRAGPRSPRSSTRTSSPSPTPEVLPRLVKLHDAHTALVGILQAVEGAAP